MCFQYAGLYPPSVKIQQNLLDGIPCYLQSQWCRKHETIRVGIFWNAYLPDDKAFAKHSIRVSCSNPSLL